MNMPNNGVGKIGTLKGKRVLITGAATGIGKAIALEFGKLGAMVGINYYPSEDQEEKAEDVARNICDELHGIGCESLLIQADVSKEDQVEKMFSQVEGRWGGLDILINNAGIQRKSPSHEVSLDQFMKVVSTDMIGSFLCSREALKLFLKHKIPGQIINNSSVHQQIPKPEYLSYSMSKGAIGNLTRTLALEYAEYGIRVNAVGPGAIVTPINPWSTDEVKKQRVASHIPLKAVGSAEQIAKAFSFLASDDANYVTGQILFVDGGLTLYGSFKDDWASG